jgi:hypothetical protein
MGAIGTRLSLRPLFLGGCLMATTRALSAPREGGGAFVIAALVIARSEATKQSIL